MSQYLQHKFKKKKTGFQFHHVLFYATSLAKYKGWFLNREVGFYLRAIRLIFTNLTEANGTIWLMNFTILLVLTYLCLLITASRPPPPQDFSQREISPRWPNLSPWKWILYTCLKVLQKKQWSWGIADFWLYLLKLFVDKSLSSANGCRHLT